MDGHRRGYQHDHRLVVILCSVADDHSDSLAAAFAVCCPKINVVLVDYDGKLYKYTGASKGNRPWAFMDQGVNLLDRVNVRYGDHSFIRQMVEHMNIWVKNGNNQRVLAGSPLSLALISPDDIRAFLRPTLLAKQFGVEEKNILYAMPPCGFDRVPAYLLHFSDKLSEMNGTWSYTSKKGQSGPALDLPPIASAQCTLIDVEVCRYIYAKGLRFYGTCHGAQMMWLALGQILTRNIRLKVDAGDSPLVNLTKDSPPHQFGFDGNSLSTINKPERARETGGVRTLGKEAAKNLTGAPNDDSFSYSTDYNHSHMMLTGGEYIDGIVWDLHEIKSEWKWPISSTTVANSPSWKKLEKRKDCIVAYFNLDNIYCFQDHPSYHVSEYTNAYGEGEKMTYNPRYEQSQLILSNYIWKDKKG